MPGRGDSSRGVRTIRGGDPQAGPAGTWPGPLSRTTQQRRHPPEGVRTGSSSPGGSPKSVRPVVANRQGKIRGVWRCGTSSKGKTPGRAGSDPAHGGARERSCGRRPHRSWLCNPSGREPGRRNQPERCAGTGHPPIPRAVRTTSRGRLRWAEQLNSVCHQFGSDPDSRPRDNQPGGAPCLGRRGGWVAGHVPASAVESTAQCTGAMICGPELMAHEQHPQGATRQEQT